MVRKKIQIYALAFLLFLCTITTAFSSCVFGAEGEEEPTVIRVGYALNYGTVKSPIIKGSEGFGYEYLNKIFSYAEGNYELEFVYCDWEESKDWLASGEIDIIGPSTYTEAGAETYLYTENSFGNNILFLSALPENVTYYNNYANMNGCRIGVQKNNPNEKYLSEFLEENNIQAEIVYFDYNDYDDILKTSDCDLCLVSSLQYLENAAPVATLGVLDFYYVTDIANEELMATMNAAMDELEKNEFMYPEQLYLEYYNYTGNAMRYISEEEFDLLHAQEVYHVGVENAYTPVCYKDNDGEWQGIAIDVLEMIEKAGDVQFEIVESATYDVEEIDFFVLSTDEAGREKATESEAYYVLPLMLIERQMKDDTEIENIGILKYYGISEVEKENYIYNREIKKYDYIVDMQAAYNAGEIDSFLVTNYTLNSIRNKFDDLQFLSTSTNGNLNLTFTFPEGYSPEKIEIFNKIIGQLDKVQVESLMLGHFAYIANNGETFDFWDFVKENLLLVEAILLLSFFGIYLLCRKHKKEISDVVNVDKLTGLSTYGGFLEQTANVLATCEANTMAILSMDIDNFKYINEYFGYEIGSKVLVMLAEQIQKNGRNIKAACRYNGDNFLLLVERSEVMGKIDVLLESNDQLTQMLRRYVGKPYNFTFSIGVYEIADKRKDLNFMIDCANIARGLGKNTAQTTVHRFSPVMEQARVMNNDIVANMVSAIEREEFILQYQPKVDLITGEMVGVEALVRWMRDGILVPPMNFVPLFERNGFIEQLDYYVLEKVCEFIQKYPDTPKISVNFSGLTVTTAEIDEGVLQIIGAYGVSPAKIDIEITETAFVEQFEYALERIETLRAYGISISMDDFGAGISSLNRLKNIPIDTIKIDREFVVDSIENPRGSQIIKNIIQMAKDLKLETVAEGIETKEQMLFLRDMGCDVGQGYYFSKPVSEDVYVEWLHNMRNQ